MQKTQQDEEIITSETMQKVKKVQFADTKDMEESEVVHENVIENANAENKLNASDQEDVCHRQNVCRLAHTFFKVNVALCYYRKFFKIIFEP